MKPLLFIIVMFLLTSISASYGQDGANETRRTVAEQEALEKSIPVNPPKVNQDNLSDSRINPVTVQPGPTNWKPAPEPMDGAARLSSDQPPPTPIQPATPSGNGGNSTQPMGDEPAGKTINFRDLKGSPQPEAPTKGQVTNYREQHNAQPQPAGGQPKK